MTEVTRWTDGDGLHLILMDEHLGFDGVQIYFSTGLRPSKRYLLVATDLGDWPAAVLRKIRLPIGIEFGQALVMRKDEQQYNESGLLAKGDSWAFESGIAGGFECFYEDELRAARALGCDIGQELLLWPQKKENLAPAHL